MSKLQITPYINDTAVESISVTAEVDAHDSRAIGEAVHEALDIANIEAGDGSTVELRVKLVN